MMVESAHNSDHGAATGLGIKIGRVRYVGNRGLRVRDGVGNTLMRQDDVPQEGLFFDMLRNRRVELEISRRYEDGEMRCPVHLSVGQEAISAGVCRAMKVGDQLVSTHRAHAHYLSKGGDLKRMLAEFHGKATGCCGGRGGSMHIFDRDAGMLLSLPIVASSIPVAVGAALAMKQAQTHSVAVVIFGDAAVEEGVFHEAANFAALKQLPVVFVCENNLFSVYTHLNDRQPDLPLQRLGAAHGIRSLTADGNDVEAVYRLTTEAFERARAGGGPSLLVFDTYRWLEHCGPGYDNDIGYRTEEEFQVWKARDPIERTRQKLFALGLLDEGSEAGLNAQIDQEIAEAFDFALESPLPTSSEFQIYA